MIHILIRSKLLLIFFAITLTSIVMTTLMPFMDVSSKYFFVDFKKLYGYEYREVVDAISVTLKISLPVVDGLFPMHVFNEVVNTARKNYLGINMVYFYIIANEWGVAFYTFVIPISMLIASIFFSAVLEVANVEKNLQVIALIGHRGYYKAIIVIAVMLSAVYASIISTPLLIYGCPWYQRLWFVKGVLSISLLFLILHLLEVWVYAITRWNNLAGLMAGLILSLTLLFSPGLLVDLISATRVFFGVKPPDLDMSLLLQFILVLSLAIIFYITVKRGEKY